MSAQLLGNADGGLDISWRADGVDSCGQAGDERLVLASTGNIGDRAAGCAKSLETWLESAGRQTGNGDLSSCKRSGQNGEESDLGVLHFDGYMYMVVNDSVFERVATVDDEDEKTARLIEY